MAVSEFSPYLYHYTLQRVAKQRRINFVGVFWEVVVIGQLDVVKFSLTLAVIMSCYPGSCSSILEAMCLLVFLYTFQRFKWMFSRANITHFDKTETKKVLFFDKTETKKTQLFDKTETNYTNLEKMQLY